MEQNTFYPEEVLIEKMESGEYGWLDYVIHHSPEWQDEYAQFCEERALEQNDESARLFDQFKNEELEIAMANGEA
ncbi:MAG: hypothetical protein LUC24_04860 [Bacteroidales bacterium]|nr:hypothetical protein [Bacteroidales bacterium]